MSVARALMRIHEERQRWRDSHPPGFSVNQRSSSRPTEVRWECVIPGRSGTARQGSQYHVELIFDQHYPSLPPKGRFSPVIFHPNVEFLTGKFYTPILDIEGEWRPTVSVRQILEEIQELIHNPVNDPDFIKNRFAANHYWNGNDPEGGGPKAREE